MNNPRRIIVILVLIAVFIVLSQQLDRFTSPPAEVPPTRAVEEQAPAPAAATVELEAYPLAEDPTPEGPYPPPKPTHTVTPEGYVPPEEKDG